MLNTSFFFVNPSTANNSNPSRENSLITQYENRFSVQAFDLLSRLLKYNPEERIGGGPDGVTEIK